MNLKNLIRTIPNYPKDGVMFRDITTLIQHPAGFRRTVDELVQPFAGSDISRIAGVEARGFILGGAVAHQLSIGFIAVRKKGKLPWQTISVEYELEYGTDELEIHIDSIEKGDRILIIDDLIATGGTAEAAAKLIEMSKGKVAGYVFVINLFDLGGCDNLVKKGFKVENLIEFPGH